MGQSTWDKRFPNNKPIENLRSGPQGQKGKFRSTTSAAKGKKMCVWVGWGLGRAGDKIPRTEPRYSVPSSVPSFREPKYRVKY
jgi:hypothetical protein